MFWVTRCLQTSHQKMRSAAHTELFPNNCCALSGLLKCRYYQAPAASKRLNTFTAVVVCPLHRSCEKHRRQHNGPVLKILNNQADRVPLGLTPKFTIGLLEWPLETIGRTKWRRMFFSARHTRLEQLRVYLTHLWKINNMRFSFEEDCRISTMYKRAQVKRLSAGKLLPVESVKLEQYMRNTMW